jgi:hypothetical protein
VSEVRIRISLGKNDRIRVMNSSIIVPAIVLLAAFGLLWQVQVFHRKLIWHLSLVQIFLLVVVPGLLFPRFFSYVLALSQTPPRPEVIVPDAVLVNIILLAVMFSYGGISIHTVTKMLSYPHLLRYDESEAGEMNKFFHLTFSHSLAFGGAVVVMLGLTLLELNHIPPTDPGGLMSGLLKGIALGGLLLLGMYNYTRYYGDEYKGKWSDLKMVFLVAWAGFMLLLYAVRRIDPSVTDYQLLLPALIGFALLGFANLFLVVRRLKRGGFRIDVRWKRIREYLSGPV